MIEKYDLQGFGAELENLWTDNTEDGASLRELAREFNQNLLRSAMEGANLDLLEGEVANTYRLLIDDDVSPADRTDARRRLQRADIDVDQLKADFVSRQAIHTFLTKVRNVTHTTEDTDPVETVIANLQRLKNRVVRVTDTKLAALGDAGHLTIGTYRVIVDIQILCEDCGQQYPFEDLLSERACGCRDS